MILLESCSNNSIRKDTDIDPEWLYFDYQVFGIEGDSLATVLLQYRLGGPRGWTVLLDEPGKVEFDGTTILPDSSKMTGPFYELQVQQQKLDGKHIIVVTANNKKEYKEEFSFEPILLMNGLPDSLERQELILQLKGLEANDYVRVLLTDTSRHGEGIDRLDTVRNGRVIIHEKDLRSLVNGPVNLQLVREYERPLKQPTKTGGRIEFSYVLQREFVLK